MAKTIGVSEARQHLGKLIEDAFYKRDSLIIERSGRPMAVLVSIEDYQKWQKLAKSQVFTMIEAVHKRNVGVSGSEIEAETNNSLKLLRQEEAREGKDRLAAF